jgi:serine protease Do
MLDELNRESESLIVTALPSVVSIEAVRGDPKRVSDQDSQAYGAGVVVRADGFIATNAHVIEAAARIEVETSGHHRFVARLVGSNEAADIALLKIDAHGLRPIPWGDSDETGVGDTVYAFGSPFALPDSVSRGIVSAKRRLVAMGAYPDVIQTDASINPGNSGGALLNVRGELVGINTAMDTYDKGRSGVGFAIPSNLIRRTVEAFLKGGRMVRPYLGVMAAERVDPPTWGFLGYSSPPAGVLMAGVYRGSPADQVGLRVDDLLVQIDGQPVTSPADLLSVVSNMAAGHSVSLSYLRRGVSSLVSVALIATPTLALPSLDIDPDAGQAIWSGGGPFEGAELREARTEDFIRTGISGVGPTGVVLIDPGHGTRSQAAGLLPEDIIAQVLTDSGVMPASPRSLADLANKGIGQDVVVLVYRGRFGMFVHIPAQ